MTTKLLKFAAIAIIGLSAIVLNSCKEEEPVCLDCYDDREEREYDIYFEKNNYELWIGGEVTVVAKINIGYRYDENLEVIWTSDNTGVVGIINSFSSEYGFDKQVKIKAISAGTATITMKVGISSAAFKVKVKETPEGGVAINGVVWAKSNVDMPGTFAENPDDYGMFYQWNRKIGWSSDISGTIICSEPETVWIDVIHGEEKSWEMANDPCPAGWRVPTYRDFAALIPQNGWDAIGKVNHTWVNEPVPGRLFTDIETENSIFFPATGYFHNIVGVGQPINSETREIAYQGDYWSSYHSGNFGYVMAIFDTDWVGWKSSSTPYTANSVRCVAE
jgi:uncharacterized protein (TIGR02145 family)